MNSYSLSQRILHDIVFSNELINNFLYEIEKKLYLSKSFDFSNNKHIFITGLPRSGTTSLLNFFYASGQFGSLKYKNMPFLLSPNLLGNFFYKQLSKSERIHMDGIKFDLNSPEAFDEYFFAKNASFMKNELNNYIRLILNFENKEKYLSKNNSNYKRINSILSLMPNSLFLIPIRDPLNHSYSLLRQHLHFIKIQRSDDFIRRYMNYIGHFEFGINHKSWCYSKNYDPLSLNYWLEQWNFFYKDIYINNFNNPSCFFIIYEYLENKNYIDRILNKAGIDNYKNFNHFKNSNKIDINIEYSQILYSESCSIYQKFIELSKFS